MLIKFYRYKHLAVIPSISVTAEGLLVDSAPVSVVDVDDPELAARVLAALEALPQPMNNDEDGPSSVILDRLGIKKWREFEPEAILFTVHQSERAVEVHITGRGDDGFWRRDDSLKHSFSLDDSPLLLADHLAQLIRQRNPVEKKAALLIGPPALPASADSREACNEV